MCNGIPDGERRLMKKQYLKRYLKLTEDVEPQTQREELQAYTIL